MATNARQFNTFLPPGHLLQEEIDAREVSRRELADILNLSVSEVGDVIAGNAPLTQTIADELERTFKTPAHIWVGLEARYRQRLERMEREPEDTIRVQVP